MNLLETHSASKLRVNPRQFGALASALLILIQTERDIYCNNATNPVIHRLSAASNFLCEMVEEALRKSSRNQPRYKHFIAIVNGITSSYFVDSRRLILDPCSVQFSRLIKICLEKEFFRFHLSNDAWIKLYDFHLRAIENVLSNDLEVHMLNEALLQELFSSLYLLIGGDSRSIFAPFLEQKRYYPLLGILSATLKLLNKRESITVVVSFKIVNKLLNVLSTEDSTFLHEIIKVAVQSFILFASSSLDSVQAQIAVFINLETFYRFMDISDIPTKKGGEAETTGNIEEENQATKETLLYNLGTLIQSIINRIQFPAFRLEPKDVGLLFSNETSEFQDRNIYLQSEKGTSWLLLRGLSKLIDKYYKLRDVISFDATRRSFEEPSMAGSVRGASFFKRQRVHEQKTYLWTCNSSSQFFNALISTFSDTKIQMIGLQLLVFHAHLLPEAKIYSSTINDEEEISKVINFNDSTIIDINLGYEDEKLDFTVSLTNVMKAIQEKSLTFWALLASQSLLCSTDITITNAKPVLAKRLHQLLKILLVHVNDVETGPLACNILFQVVLQQREKDLTKLLDKILINQFENILDLSELGGPIQVDHSALRFWWAISKLFSVVTHSSDLNIANSIGRWFIMRWSEKYIDTSGGLKRFKSLPFPSHIVVSDILLWIGGKDVIHKALNAEANLHESLDEFRQKFEIGHHRLQLERFIALDIQKPHSMADEAFALSFPSLSPGIFVFETMIERISDVSTLLCASDVEDIETLVSWASSLLMVADSLSEYYKQASIHLQNGARNIWNLISQNINLTYDASITISCILNCGISKELLENVSFPFEALEYHFRASNLNTIDLIETSEATSDFDSEFSPSKENFENKLPSSRDDRAFEKSTYAIQYFKFLFTFFKGADERPLRYLERLAPKETLSCMAFVADNISKDESYNIDPHFWTRLIRLMGEGPLADHETDRSDETVCISCKLLGILVPMSKELKYENLAKDCLDLLDYFIQCCQKSLLMTENSQSRVWNLIFNLIGETKLDLSIKLDIERLFLSSFERFSNGMIISTAETIEKFLARLHLPEQMMFYSNLITHLQSHSGSSEAFATHCLFFCLISKNKSQMRISALFNLIECTTLAYFEPYLRQSVNLIGKLSHFDNTKALFKFHRIELLKCWWTHKKHLLEFPCRLFEYPDNQSFLRENYEVLIAILLSIKHQFSSHVEVSVIEKISKIKSSDPKSMICDSLPLIIPLAYTSEGTRNQIFKTLAYLLKDSFKVLMEEKLILVVLQIVKLTDPKSEEAFKLALGLREDSLFESPDILDISIQAVVSPMSSYDLINALIKKYWQPSKSEFWKPQSVYFIVRQLGRDTNPSSMETTISSLRKIKYVLQMSKITFNRLEFVKLILDICYPLFDSAATKDLSTIWKAMSMEFIQDSQPVDTVPVIFDVLNLILKNKDNLGQDFKGENNFQNSSCFDCLIESFPKYKSNFGTALPIIEGAISLASKNFANLTLTSIEEFLIDPYYHSAIFKHACKIFPVISQLFSQIASCEINETNPKLTAVFVHLNLDDYISEKFQIWISRYLAKFYLSGDLQESDEFVLNNESYVLNEGDFDKKCKTMDYFIDAITLHLDKGNFHDAAFIENILGALLWKFEVRPREVQKFLSFDNFYAKFLKYLMCIDFHSCVLLNSESDMQIHNSDLTTFITNFGKIFCENSIDDWTSHLILALLEEVATYTSLSSLFASIIVKITSISKEVLPSFICFFISLTGKSGAAKIHDFLKTYWESFRPPYDQESISLIKEIVLLIRAGATQKVEIFAELYASLNLENMFQIIKESNLPKLSLMVFEDLIDGKVDNVRWVAHRKPIAAIYESLDEKDMLSGLPEDGSLNYNFEIIDELENSLDRMRYSNGFLDASMAITGKGLSAIMIKSMMADGILGASALVDKNSGENRNLFEWAWKLNQWDICLSGESLDKHEKIFSYFKQINDDVSQREEIFNRLMLSIMRDKRNILDRELSYKRRLELTRQWFETMACIYASDRVLSSPISCFTEEIESFDTLTSWFETTESSFSENVLHSRQLSFELYGKNLVPSNCDSSLSITSSVNANHDICWQAATAEVFRKARLFQENSQLQKMVSATIFMNEFVQSLEFSDVNVQSQLLKISKFQAANSFWFQGKTGKSVVMLQELNSSGPILLPFKKLCIDAVLVKSILVKRLAASRKELGTSLLERLVNPMKEDIDLVDDLLQRGRIYQALAHFCDQQYKSQTLSEQIKEYSTRVEGKKEEIEGIKSHYGRTSVTALEKKAVQKYYTQLKGQVAADSSKLENLIETKRLFALNAVEFFLKTLLLDDASSSEDLDRFFSLFLSLGNEELLQRSIQEEICLIPSHKPLQWCTQLLSRISNEESVFQESVQNLVMRVFRDHPFHSLYYLISLVHHEDYSKDAANNFMLPKVEAAKKLREMLISTDLLLSRDVLLPIEKLFGESIALAELKISKGKAIHLDKLKVGTYWLSELPQIPPPTLDLPVSKTGYSNVPRMVKVDPKVSVATSGISLPKIASFVLSDGTQHKMLLKSGADDLRQDATMEQVFEKVNKFFRKDKETRKRHLRVRTYKAVPLGPKAGVIEFVPNSKAFIEVIRPFHQKKDTIKLEKAREMMKECQTDLTNRRLVVYKGITQKIKPVLRQYFVETFITPDLWFEARQMYTRGIAATSMVGYILGLGDRHCNNILLDQSTGEPIHIDLGVAFDQGRRLPIPETVPFRLTRDIVDGFGFTGTKGAFSKLSEHTLRVLRDNRDHIISILDVLRWDPLYSWSISPIRRTRLQEDTGAIERLGPQEDGSEASAAVATVKDKIHHEGLSAEATVRELVREATSEDNLSVIYCGWCPFY